VLSSRDKTPGCVRRLSKTGCRINDRRSQAPARRLLSLFGQRRSTVLPRRIYWVVGEDFAFGCLSWIRKWK